MTFPPIRRAALLGLPLAVAACDVLQFVSDPKPIFEETWSVPAETTTVSVASLLPPGVSIYSTPPANVDSSAFLVDINTVPINRRVGDDCAQCQTLNGTNAFKPAFVLAAGNTQALPTDMVSGTVLGGQLIVTLTNNMSFDPLHVKTGAGAQGRMDLVIRSGSLVLGRDSVFGTTTTFLPATQMIRTISLATGNVTSSLTVDVTVDSPIGDHNEFINANGTLNASATLKDASNQPTLRVGSVSMNVVNRSMTSTVGDSLPLKDIGETITKHVVAGTLAMTISNPFGVTGNVSVSFGYAPSLAVTKSVAMPTGTNQQASVTLDSTEMHTLLGKTIGLSVGGSVSSAAPITVTPKQVLLIDNRLVLKIHVGGGS